MQNKVLSLVRPDFMLILGFLLAVLICTSEAKHVTTNYRTASTEDAQSYPIYPEDNNVIRNNPEEENHYHGQEENWSQSLSFDSNAYFILVGDDHLEFQGVQDDEEERKMMSDSLRKACTGKKYLECHQKYLTAEIIGLPLLQLSEAYAQYAYGATWKTACSESSRSFDEFPLASHVNFAVTAAKNCASLSTFEMRQANKPSLNNLQDNFNSDHMGKFACVMGSTYEIVAMLTWFVDVLHLDVSISNTDPQNMKYAVLEHVTQISDSFIRMHGLILHELSSYDNMPNNDVVVKIMNSRYKSAYGEDAGARGCLIINLLMEVMHSLTDL